jgi:putative RecB family exonuclease
MAFDLPVSLSPSKVASFKDCAMMFRFSAIDRVPEPPSPWAAKGTLVHRALELLMLEAPGDRTIESALRCLGQAVPEILDGPEYADLPLTDDERETFLVDADLLVRKYFQLEDPTSIRPIGLELRMEATLGSLRLRGIIDRLELGPNGELIVTDYKTGKVPGVNYEQGKLGGVQFYAYLCEQMLGRRPDKVQLLYLSEPLAIVHEPTDQSIRGLTMRAKAIWTAVERACEREDFRPKPSRLCNVCSFKQWCPAFGGDPLQAPRRTHSASRGTALSIAESGDDLLLDTATPGTIDLVGAGSVGADTTDDLSLV